MQHSLPIMTYEFFMPWIPIFEILIWKTLCLWHSNQTYCEMGLQGGRGRGEGANIHKFCQNAAVLQSFGTSIMQLQWTHQLGSWIDRAVGWGAMVELVLAESSTNFPNIWKGIQRNYYYYCYLLDDIHWQTDSLDPGWMAWNNILQCTDNWIILRASHHLQAVWTGSK